MKTPYNRHSIGLTIFATISTIIFPMPDVIAQETGVLEEIIVTARKREENIQDVGISMSAASKQEIERRFITDIRDLVDISPNLIIDDTAQGPGGVAATYIRGIGVADVESNFDPAVATVIDGIYHGKSSGGILKTFDVESVEVLRGPQGTLFGRNSIGGVIKLERTRPTGEFGGKLRAGYGDYDSWYADGILNFGLGDQLAIKLSASRREQNEGYFENVNTGTDNGRSEYTSFGVNALFMPMDNLELEVTYDLERTTQDTPSLLYVGQPGQLFCDVFGYCAPDVDTPLSGDRYKTTQLGPDGFNNSTFDTDTAILEGRWELTDAYRLDYIGGHRETDETVLTDWDAVPAVLFHTTRPEQYEQDSHELRLTYDAGGPLSYVLGGYYWDSEYDIQLVSYIGFVVPNVVLALPRTSRQETENWAVFFEGDYDVTDQLTLTVGGRYSHDKKTSQHTGFPTTDKVSENWNEFTPKASIKFRYNDDLMFYFTYTAGYRSGGFNGRPETIEAATIPYEPETVDNYEGGFKSEWFDNRFRLNASFFYMEYDDKQEEVSAPVSIGTGQQTIISNIASATMKGVEVDASAYISDHFTMRGNFGWLDAEYDEFVADLVASGTPTDNSYLKFRRAPEFTIGLAGTYEWETMNGLAWVRAGYHYIDDTEVSVFNTPQTHNDAQHLIDASINYQYKNTTFSFYGRNLTDEDAYTISLDVAGPNGLWTYTSPRAPRTWGLEISHSFGAN